MSPSIQQKMKQYQELAKLNSSPATRVPSAGNNSHDGLIKAIRTKEDAAIFMAELKAAIEQSK